MPSFPQVLAGIARAYREQHGEIVEEAARLVEALQRSAQVTPSLAGGPVSFMDGTVLVGNANLNVNGIAQMTTTRLSVGVHLLRA